MKLELESINFPEEMECVVVDKWNGVFLGIENEFRKVGYNQMLKKQVKINSLLKDYFPKDKRIQSIKYALFIEGVAQEYFSDSLKELDKKEKEKVEAFFEKTLA